MSSEKALTQQYSLRLYRSILLINYFNWIIILICCSYSVKDFFCMYKEYQLAQVCLRVETLELYTTQYKTTDHELLYFIKRVHSINTRQGERSYYLSDMWVYNLYLSLTG